MLIGFLLQAQTVVNDLSGSVSELPGQVDELRFSVFELALKGGWIMAVLAVFSIIAVYIFIERYLVISMGLQQRQAFYEQYPRIHSCRKT